MTTLTTIPDQQIAVNGAATLRWVHTDGNGEPTAAVGTVTVAGTRADGTTITFGSPNDEATADTAAPGHFTFTFPAASNTRTDVITFAWTDDGDGTVGTTVVEVVGGFLFDLDEARNSHPSLGELSDHTLDLLRYVVADELEWITNRAFTVRYARITTDGSGDVDLMVPSNERGSGHDLRDLVSVAVDGTTYTTAERNALTVYDNRIGQAPGQVWSIDSRNNVTIAYHYGLNVIPPELKVALLERLRIVANRSKNAIPDRATSLSLADFGVMQLATADRYSTGYPEIDARYARWSNRSWGDTSKPVSMSYDFNPQYWSLFHGGTR